MTGLDSVRQAMADFLKSKGLVTICAWPESRRAMDARPVVAVSVRRCESGPTGFRDYLGERYNTTTKRWEEIYGKRMRMGFGLDIYLQRQSGAAAAEAVFNTMADAFSQGGPEGIAVKALSCGETEYDREAALYKRTVEAECEVWLYAAADEGGAFLDFEVRGKRKL